MFVCPVLKISQVKMKRRRRASHLSRDTLWNNSHWATTQLGRFTLCCTMVAELLHNSLRVTLCGKMAAELLHHSVDLLGGTTATELLHNSVDAPNVEGTLVGHVHVCPLVIAHIHSTKKLQTFVMIQRSFFWQWQETLSITLGIEF